METKSTKKKHNSSDIKVYSLGGLGVVGMNMYIVETNKELLIMDSGILFADGTINGVEYIIPDFSHLKKNEHKIVITEIPYDVLLHMDTKTTLVLCHSY